MTRSLVVLACLLLAACAQQTNGASKRLGETLQDMNKSTRWGQLGEAARWVEPSYRARFAETHLHWGRSIQVADSEIVGVQMDVDKSTAVALVSYEWYSMDAMTLHTTVVQQRWSEVGDNYLLISERVVQGDGRLLGQSKDVGDESVSADALSIAPPG